MRLLPRRQTQGHSFAGVIDAQLEDARVVLQAAREQLDAIEARTSDPQVIEAIRSVRSDCRHAFAWERRQSAAGGETQ